MGSTAVVHRGMAVAMTNRDAFYIGLCAGITVAFMVIGLLSLTT